jgi:phosphatidylglycerol:prolipoprotein diacylglycerol transferase
MVPELFRIGGRVVSGYGIFLTAGYAGSFLAILFLAKKRGLPLKETASFLLFAAAVVLLGARIPFLFQGGAAVEAAALHDGGGYFYAGLAAGILFSLLYLPLVRLPLWSIADIVAAGTALGYAIARVGCFLGGCCYGRPATVPWAVLFPGLPGPVHPTQLYEAGFQLTAFFILIAVLRRKAFDGQILALDIIMNSLIRLGVGYYRDNTNAGFLITGASPFLSLSVPQFLALVGVATGLAIYFLRRGRRTAAMGT